MVQGSGRRSGNVVPAGLTLALLAIVVGGCPAPAPRLPLDTGPAIAPVGPIVEAVVIRVIDGDTVQVTVDGERRRVRYIGIDAPELGGIDATPEPNADAATDANEELVRDRLVSLERDVSDVDRFGRLLRYVWLRRGTGWLLVNRELVARGAADARAYPPDMRWQAVLEAADGD